MTAGERGVDQFSDPWVARVDRQPGALGVHLDDLVRVGQVELAGRRPGCTGSWPASRCPYYRCVRRCRARCPRRGPRRPSGPIPRRPPRCRGRCACAAIRSLRRVAPTWSAEILHLIGKHVRCTAFDRGRQVDDAGVCRRRLPDRDHRITDLDRIVPLGSWKSSPANTGTPTRSRDVCAPRRATAARPAPRFA